MDADRPSVLVVEDDDATRSFLAENLTADGFRVAGASAAGEGLRAIEVRKPDLVVLDLMLEDGSGLALLDRIRGADGLASRIDPALPVIVVTGRTGEADRVRGFARGADDYVAKPSGSGDERRRPGRTAAHPARPAAAEPASARRGPRQPGARGPGTGRRPPGPQRAGGPRHAAPPAFGARAHGAPPHGQRARAPRPATRLTGSTWAPTCGRSSSTWCAVTPAPPAASLRGRPAS